MKRDMDLVRKILLAFDENRSGFAPRPLTIDGYTDEEVGYHVLLMDEAGLLVGKEVTSSSGSKSPSAIPIRMTWDGHDFLDAARDAGRWSKATAAVGSAAFDVLKFALGALAKDQATKLIGGT
jgi:YD repeat-containing protein